MRAFQAAAATHGGRVIATDANPGLSAACQVADYYAQVPRIQDPDFLTATYELANRYDIGLIVPTLDTELAAYASVRDAWGEERVAVSVSSEDFVATCSDKRRTARLFDGLGISPIREVTNEFPRFVKPISGSLSRDVHLIRDASALPLRLNDRSQFLHQELIDRSAYEEYTVDLLYSRTATLVCAVPRRRIEVRGGEISKGRIERGLVLDLVRSSMDSLAGARGCITAQLFAAPDLQDRPLVGIEVNARFGGGFPMSHAAGANYAQWLLDEHVTGKVLDYRDDWRSGVTFLRYDEQVLARD